MCVYVCVNLPFFINITIDKYIMCSCSYINSLTNDQFVGEPLDILCCKIHHLRIACVYIYKADAMSLEALVCLFTMAKSSIAHAYALLLVAVVHCLVIRYQLPLDWLYYALNNVSE